VFLTGKCPASPALQGRVKGRNLKRNYLTGKPFGMLRAESSVERRRPLGRGASLTQRETNLKLRKREESKIIDNILFARYGLGMLESKSQEWKR
jgi:hypothetical protein